MCGIVGVGGAFMAPNAEAVVRRMNAAITHRGPDDSGTWAEQGFGFGMQRLSIIDLAGGHQPMWDEQTGTGIVYNGEVYNYRALRGDLERQGVRFRTNSDTEVVLQAFAARGFGAVENWNGMFAVAFWNRNVRRLTLMRDRLGIKPLYYYWDGATFLFASEIKALLASGLFRPRLNRQSLWDYLTFRYVPGPESIWQDIYKVPPGHLLEWSPGAPPALRSYWQTDVQSAPLPFSLDEKSKEFDTLLLDAVNLRLLASDVPVGVLLSGGLDSSVMAAAAVELGHRRFHTFSVGFAEGGAYSELSHARAMAEHVGADHHEVVLDRAGFLELLPTAVRALDEPLADLAAVPLLAVSRLARGWVKVVLSGEGSDEILAGYNFDRAVRRWEQIRRFQALPSALRHALALPLGLLPGKWGALARQVALVPLSKLNATLNTHMTRHWRQADKRQIWPDFAGLDSDRILQSLYAGSASADPLEQVLSVYQRSWLVEDLLMKADKMTMATSLELRVPFLDYRLVEWVNAQPPALKVGAPGNGRAVTKLLLRRFAEKRLPAAIINRPKQGFPVPAYQWLRETKFSRWAAEHLTGAGSKTARFLSAAAIQAELGRAARGDASAANKVWLLIVLETWLRSYDVDVEQLTTITDAG